MCEQVNESTEKSRVHSMMVVISVEMAAEISQWILLMQGMGNPLTLTDKVAGALALGFEKEAKIVNLTDVQPFKT